MRASVADGLELPATLVHPRERTMPNKRKPKSDAARARTLLDKGLAPSEVARKLGTSRQAVHLADARRKRVGRPQLELERRRVTISVSPETDEWLRAEADRDGCSLGDVVEGARLAITAADTGEDPALARMLHKIADVELRGDASYILQALARNLYADARSMRESFPELAVGHGERAAALSLAVRVLLDVELAEDFDLCAAHARATRRTPTGDQTYAATIARTDAVLQRAAAKHEADAREADRDPTSSAFTPDYHRDRASELHAKYGTLDPQDPT